MQMWKFSKAPVICRCFIPYVQNSWGLDSHMIIATTINLFYFYNFLLILKRHPEPTATKTPPIAASHALV